MKTKALLAIFFGVAFLAIGPIVIAYSINLADMETRAMTGEILPFAIDPQQPIEIQLGGVHVISNMSELSNGFNLSRYIYLGFDYPFSITLKNQRFLVSVDIKNANGDTIAKIVDNQWSVNNNNVIAYDRNYNSYAFEVIDSDLVPVIQVFFTPQNKMYLGGFFYVPNGTLLLSNDTMIFNPSSAQLNSSLPRLFEYPSEQHLGEMIVKSTYPVIRTSTEVFTGGAVITALGILLTTYTGFVELVQRGQKQTRRESRTPLSEWRNRTKRLFQKASSRAFADNKEGRKKPDEKEFEKETISYAEQFALDEKEDITKKQGTMKGEEFYNRFKQIRSHLEKGKGEEDIETIIRNWHDRLMKKGQT